MQVIDWSRFGVKGVSNRDSFQDLCLHLFCRRHSLPDGISSDFNQKGLETLPVKVNGKTYGFQSKYFDHGVSYSQIQGSISKALDEHGKELDEICIYINSNAKPHTSKAGKKIEDEAAKYGVTIEWFVRTNFTAALAQPQNLDLAQLYFGLGATFEFINDSADPKKITLINSNEFMGLKFLDPQGNITSNPEEDVLGHNQKLVLLSGDPASGKSTEIHRMFVVYSGMNESDSNKMLDKIVKNGAIPQVVNLKQCVGDTLENIIRGRQTDFKIRNQSVSIIYLLDGLDEISEDRADLILLQISELAKKTNTKKIIVTCRTGNLNRIKLRNYFDDCIEYKIDQLNEEEVENYFKTKDDAEKIKCFYKLKKINPALLGEITDVLGLRLFWEGIERLNQESTILDLYEVKIKRILNDPQHSKDLNSLNLPNKKEHAILQLNQKIAYRFQEKFQFLLPLKELQQLVMSAYPKVDYKSTNAIINYIAGAFFDTSDPEPDSTHFIYKHRRYQEYFFVKRLQYEYSRNPLVLRGLSILSNREMMENFFMKGLHKVYITNGDIVGCLDMSLLDVYLGNHKGWGVDSPYYLNSERFIEALIEQQDEVFNVLFEDESLNLKEKIDIDLPELKQQFEIWKSNKNNFRAEQYLIGVWEGGLGWMMDLVVDFSRAGRKDIANSLITKIVAVQDLYKKNKFLASLREDRKHSIKGPYWEHFESHLYYLMCIKDQDVKEIFNKQIKPNLSLEDDDLVVHENGKRKLVNSYLRVLLDNKPGSIIEVIDEFDEYVMSGMLKLMLDPKWLPVFIDNPKLHKAIENFTKNYPFELNKSNYHLLFFKRFFDGQTIFDKEKEFLKNRRQEILKVRDMEWGMYDYSLDFAVISYVLDENSFDNEIDRASDNSLHLHHYNERVVFAALFKEFVTLLNGQTTLEKIYRKYVKYCAINYDDMRYYRSLRYPIGKLWAHIYANSSATNEVKILLKRRLFDELNVPNYYFHLSLNEIDGKLFSSITSEEEIEAFEAKLDTWGDDFQTKTDRYLELSLMYRFIDTKKASSLFMKAIIDGTLRHGWRKDPIIHNHLIMALDILLKHRWLQSGQLESALDMVFVLAMKAIQISDGSGTNRGPYLFVKLVSQHDRDLAEKFKTKYVEEEGRHNISNSIITPIILSKVRAGFSLEDIEDSFKEFYMGYDFEGYPESDYFEQKFIIYVAIAQSDLYFDDERKTALKSARSLVERMKQEKVRHFLYDLDFMNEKQAFIELCKKYKLKPNVEINKDGNYHKDDYSETIEDGFVAEVIAVKTPQKLRGLYRKLKNYKNNIELAKSDSWAQLIDKTYEVNGNIKLFIDYLSYNSFPHTDFYSSNSRHLHYGLAHALNDPNYKQEVLNYIYKNGGHGGFLNVMKAYAEVGDKDMCLKLFYRFADLCKLLAT